jgi:hypothetical protein
MPSSGQTGGQHTYTVNTTDRYGNTLETQYTYFIPSKLYIYNVTPNSTDQHELIKGTDTEVEVTATGSGNTVTIRTVSDGVVELSNLPPDESYVFSLSLDGYHDRETYVESLYDQQAIFVLNDSRPYVTNQISIEDRSGEYSELPVIKVQRVINTTNVGNMSDNGYQWVTVAGDRLGAGNTYTTNLEKESRYRFIVKNQDGDQRVLGEYTARLDGTVPLEIGSVSFNAEIQQGVAFQASAFWDSGSRYLRLIAFAGESEVKDIEYRVVRADNESNVVISNTTVSLAERETVITRNLSAVDPSATEDQGYKVEWTITKDDGSTVSNHDYVGTLSPLGFGLDQHILSLIGWVALVAFAGFTALRSPKMSVTGTPIMAAGFSMFGILNIPNVLLILAGAIGAFYLIGERRGR